MSTYRPVARALAVAGLAVATLAPHAALASDRQAELAAVILGQRATERVAPASPSADRPASDAVATLAAIVTGKRDVAKLPALPPAAARVDRQEASRDPGAALRASITGAMADY